VLGSAGDEARPPTPPSARPYRKIFGEEGVALSYPLLLDVTGTKARLGEALALKLTVGACADIEDYNKYLRPTELQRALARRGGRQAPVAQPGRFC
jgi:hypothetical protein